MKQRAKASSKFYILSWGAKVKKKCYSGRAYDPVVQRIERGTPKA